MPTNGSYAVQAKSYRSNQSLQCAGASSHPSPSRHEQSELLEAMWPEEYVTEAVLTRSVRLIRQAVGDAGHRQRVIKTLRGYGYRFIADVNAHPAEAMPDTVSDRRSRAVWDEGLPEMPSPRMHDAVERAQGVPSAHDEQSMPETAAPPAAERRQLTVLSLELLDAASLTMALDPEALHGLMQEFHAACVAILDPFDGFIAYRTDYGMVVYFGYPQAHEDDALRAVRAGLALVAQVPTLSVEDAPLSVRIGIHTGIVITAPLVEEARQDALAMGATSTIASGLRQMAEPNTVVVSETTARLIQGHMQWQQVAPYQTASPSRVLEVYWIVGESAAQTRLEVGALRGLTPFVGREAELLALQDRWVQVQEGIGQVVLLRGEAGIGKSRLIREFQDRLNEIPHTCLEGRSLPYYQNTTWYPITELLERTLPVQREATSESALQQLEHSLSQYGLPLEEAVPLMARLLALPLPEGRYAALSWSPQRQRQQTLETLLAMVLALSEQQPVLLILEDLHWTDPSTLEFLDLLMEQTPTASILMLLTCRPTFDRRGSRRADGAEVTLHRLSRPQVEQIAQGVAGEQLLPPEVLQQIVDKTDGVPLFVEELTKTMVESGHLKAAHASHQGPGVFPTLAIPATLQDSLMARLDRLTTAKGVAQLGAVIGRRFSYTLLQAVSELDEVNLQAELGKLIEADLVHPRGVGPHATFVFKHALVRDAAYQSLLNRTRQDYHHRIVAVLETDFPDMAETEPEVLAHHYSCTGLHQQAVAYWKHAGEMAAARSAHREAIICFEQALAALDQLPACRETREQAIYLRLILRGSLHPLGELRQIVDHLSEAETLAVALADPHRLGLVWARMGHYAWSIGDQEQFINLSQRGLATAERCQNIDLQIQAYYYLGAAHHVLGNYAQAIDYLQRVVSALKRDPLWKPVGMRTLCSVTSRAYLAWSLAEVGVFAEGIRLGEEGIRIVEDSGQAFSGIVGYVGLGLAYLRKGELDSATEVLERGLRCCQSADIPFWLPGLQGALGAAHVIARRATTALPLLAQAVE